MRKLLLSAVVVAALLAGFVQTGQAFQVGGGNHCFNHSVSGVLTCLVHLSGGMYVYQFDDHGWSWVGGN